MLHLKRDEKGRTLRIYGDDQTRVCPVCNKSFLVPAWRAADPKRGKFCSKKCSYVGRELKNIFQKGHPDFVPKEKRGHSPETRLKMKEINKRIAVARRASNPEPLRLKRQKLMRRSEYKDWRRAIFERDNYTCQICKDNTSYIHADHIESWSANEDKRYSLDNGITLCFRCHYKKTFPNREYVEDKALMWGVPNKYRKSNICQIAIG